MAMAKSKHHYSHVKRGFREDLGTSVRSSREANVARYLKFLGCEWEYEPVTFYFRPALPGEDESDPRKRFLPAGKKGITRGTLSYTPDFWCVCPENGTGQWIECKGYLDRVSQTKLKRFKKYYPKEFDKLHLVVGSLRSKAAVFALDLGIPIERLIQYKAISSRLRSVIPEWE
jgi:hypothetical protein